MTTNKILSDIRDNGGFDNFNRWSRKEITEWVENYFNCSKYVANNVSLYLK